MYPDTPDIEQHTESRREHWLNYYTTLKSRNQRPAVKSRCYNGVRTDVVVLSPSGSISTKLFVVRK